MKTNKETYLIHTLPNGLRIIFMPNSSDVAYCGLSIDAGSRDEQDGSHGLAHFVEHTIFKGTRHRRAWHILNRMERVGGELNAYTTKENTTVYSVFPCKHLARAVELISDLVAYSIFPENELDKEREVVLDEAASYRDAPAEAVCDDFEDMIWKGNPLGHNILGIEQDLRRFTGDDCRNYLNNLYVPTNMVFFVLGNYKESMVFHVVERYFGSLCHPLSKPVRMQPQQLPPFDIRQTIGSHQAHTIYGAPIFSMYDHRRYAMLLLNNMLGGPGMNSMLNIAIRERRGYAYTVESSISLFSDCGLMQIYFGSDSKHVTPSIKLISSIINDLASSPVSEKALDAAKKQFIGQLLVSSDNNEALALSMGKSFLYYGHVADNEETTAHIMDVTPSQIMEAAAIITPGHASTLTFE